jgi:dipeptidyl aminopeptidase/acylaminoacyl peptidase
MPLGNQSIFVQAVEGEWKKIIPGVTFQNSSFSPDGKFLIYKTKGDTLVILTLGGAVFTYLSNIANYKVTSNPNGKWLLYQLKDADNTLVAWDCRMGDEIYLKRVNRYYVSIDGNILVVEDSINRDSIVDRSLNVVNLTNLQKHTIWQSSDSDEIGSVVFDNSSHQIAFVVKHVNKGLSTNEVGYYLIGASNSVVKVCNQIIGIDTALMLSSEGVKFGENENELYVRLKLKKEGGIRILDGSKVDIWSYKDVKLQSLQLSEANYFQRGYTAVYHIKEEKIIKLEGDGDGIVNNSKGPFVLIKNEQGSFRENNWNPSAMPSYYIVSKNDGSRKKLKGDFPYLTSYQLSPSGKFLIYFDYKKNDYFSLNVESGKICNITKTNNHIQWTEKNNDRPGLPPLNGIAAWHKDNELFIYDNNDIWLVDPSGVKGIVNITNRYGLLHNIKFVLTSLDSASLNKADKLLLAAFDYRTKENGFYISDVRLNENPQKVTMGPYLYYWPFLGLNFSPIKIESLGCFIVQRRSAIDAPNFYITKDFKDYRVVSDINPQKTYNWLTTELIKWKTFDGHVAHGILYKPENFNPQKKYPIIFCFYETQSQNLYNYYEPYFSIGQINIPYFVSNGYLVFTPDIHFEIGNPGNSFYNYVVSAALNISKYSWVNRNRMGIQGHSFGGYGVNYIVTRTNIFKAAVSASGLSDLVSFYGNLAKDGVCTQFFSETSQLRIGSSLWESPMAYVKNSPVFGAHKVVTPLLMMNNKGDSWNLFPQGVEFFSALRRLGKKAWMLQYDNSGHSVSGKDAKDFTIRLTQFFDYYLKDSLPPKWLTSGISASRKGIDFGFELQNSVNP